MSGGLPATNIVAMGSRFDCWVTGDADCDGIEEDKPDEGTFVVKVCGTCLVVGGAVPVPVNGNGARDPVKERRLGLVDTVDLLVVGSTKLAVVFAEIMVGIEGTGHVIVRWLGLVGMLGGTVGAPGCSIEVIGE